MEGKVKIMKNEIIEMVNFLSSPSESVYGLGAIFTPSAPQVKSITLVELLKLKTERRDESALRKVLFLKIQTIEELAIALKTKRTLYQSIVLIGMAEVLDQSDELLRSADCIVRSNQDTEVCYGA